MNGYVCFYLEKRTEVEADSSYSALCKAKAIFQAGTRRKVQDSQIAVVLAERNGEQVTHSTGSL